MSSIPTNNQTDIGVRHYKNARDSWKVGSKHFWLRYRGLLFGICITVATMGMPWWWPSAWSWKPFPSEVTFHVARLALCLATAAVLVVIAIFVYARRRAQRSVFCKDRLHNMSHVMRDTFCELLKRTGARKSKHDLAHEKRHLLESSNAIAKSIADYYRVLTGCECIGVVIRLAADKPNDGIHQTFYISVGRAGAINQTRQDTTEPIQSSEGIPKLLRSKEINASGILFFDNISQAIRHGIYKETDNEKSFPDDYRYVIAVPLNGWNGTRKDLIGLLTITGRSSKILRVEHVDLLKAIGDRLAEHYAATVARLSATNRMPNLFSDNEQPAQLIQ